VQDTYRRNLLIGAFVIIGLITLGAMIIMFGEAPQAFTRTYTVNMFFPAAGPVRESDPVLLNGIEIGRIVAVIPQPDIRDGIKFVASVDADYRIPIDAVPLIREQTLALGRPAVRIDVGPENSDQMLPTDGTAVLRGDFARGIEELIPKETMQDLQTAGKKLTELAVSLKPVAADLHELLQSRPIKLLDDKTDPNRPLANIATAVQRLDATLKNFNEVIGDPQSQHNLKAAVANFHAISRRGIDLVDSLKALAGRLIEVTDNVDTQVNRISQRITDAADQLSHILDDFSTATDQLARGEGSAGRFLRDPELYESLALTSRRLQLAIDDLRALLRQWHDQGVKIQGGLLGK